MVKQEHRTQVRTREFLPGLAAVGLIGLLVAVYYAAEGLIA